MPWYSVYDSACVECTHSFLSLVILSLSLCILFALLNLFVVIIVPQFQSFDSRFSISLLPRDFVTITLGKKSHLLTRWQTNKINDDHQNIRRLFVCLSWWPYDVWAYLRNLFGRKGAPKRRKPNKPNVKKERMVLPLPRRATIQTTTWYTKPDKYKRITSRKIIVIVFLFSFRCFVVAVLLCYFYCIDWVPNLAEWNGVMMMKIMLDASMWYFFHRPRLPFLSKRKRAKKKT